VSAPDDSTYAIFDEGDLRKYRTELPNIVDDLGLSPHAYRLYGHMKRVCGANPSGQCYQGTRTLAKHCKMSVGKISEAKKELIAFKLIAVETFPASKNKPDQIRILDVWRANFERYAPVQNMNTPVQVANTPVHMVNRRKNPLRRNPLRTQQILKKEEKQATSGCSTGEAFTRSWRRRRWAVSTRTTVGTRTSPSFPVNPIHRVRGMGILGS
jgi:hypothetical protein